MRHPANTKNIGNYWTDRETRLLLAVRTEGYIDRQITGTVKDTVIYEKITEILHGRGVRRQKTQIINKLKSLRKKFFRENENWHYYDTCRLIWGKQQDARIAIVNSFKVEEEDDTHSPILIEDDEPTDSPTFKVEVEDEFPVFQRAEEETSQTTNNVEIEDEFPVCKGAEEEEASQTTNTVTPSPPPSNTEETSQTTNHVVTSPSHTGEAADSIEELGPLSETAESPAESEPESPCPPPRTKQKRLSRAELMVSEMKQLFSEMDSEFHERESLRLREQRAYEDRVRRENREYEQRVWEREREASERQMTMWKEMQDCQNNILLELINRLPLPTLPA